LQDYGHTGASNGYDVRCPYKYGSQRMLVVVIRHVIIVVSLGTNAVTGCPSGCRLSMR